MSDYSCDEKGNIKIFTHIAEDDFEDDQFHSKYLSKGKGKRNHMLLASLKQHIFLAKDNEIKMNYIKKQYSDIVVQN